MNKTNNKKKKFDSIEWVRKIRDNRYKRYKNMSESEYISFINEQAKKQTTKKLSKSSK